MLYLGEGYNKMFLINQGKVIWTYSTGGGNEYDDVWMLSNGNILFTRMQYLAEVTPKKEVVWRYDAPKGTEIHACQPIGLDKVLFVANGKPPKLMVVNIKTKAVEVEHDLPFDAAKDVHPQFRRIRYTAQGTYLVPFLNMNKVAEYDKDFKELWSYEIRSPWAAIRLKNGNTLITDEGENSRAKSTPRARRSGNSSWRICRRPIDLPSRRRVAPGWPTATRSSAPVVRGAKARNSSKSRPTRRSCGSCKIGRPSARHLPCKSWTTPASRKIRGNRNIDLIRLPKLTPRK